MAPTGCRLLEMPDEILEMIAKAVRSDKDLSSLRAVSQRTRKVIGGEGSAFWKSRYLDRYDSTQDGNGKPGLSAYVSRRKIESRGWARFAIEQAGVHEQGRHLSLDHIRNLIKEAYSPNSLVSKNMQVLCQAVNDHEFLHHLVESRGRLWSGLYSTVFVMLTPLAMLHVSETPRRMRHAGVRQQLWQRDLHDIRLVVYPGRHELFRYRGLGIEWLAAAAGFFVRQLERGRTNIFKTEMAQLTRAERPQVWCERLEETENCGGTCGKDCSVPIYKPKGLAKTWLGSFAFLDRPDGWDLHHRGDPTVVDCWPDEAQPPREVIHELRFEFVTRKFRKRKTRDDYCSFEAVYAGIADEMNGGALSRSPPRPGNPQGRGASPSEPSILSQMEEDRSHIWWPTEFEDICPASWRDGPCEEEQAIYVRAEEPGQANNDGFRAVGWLTAKHDQEGIPGWQRIYLISFKTENTTGSDRVDPESLCSWEGIVLPGGRMIIGQWLKVMGDPIQQFGGPFLWWNVPDDRELTGGR